MITIQIIGLDHFVVGQYSREHLDNLAQLYESDPDLIARLQDRLTGWGWLEADTFERGELDGATLQAVRDFQAWYNDAYGEALSQAAASVDAATTALLLNQDGDVYAK